MNSLLAKAGTFWSCLIGRKLNSLKCGKVIQVVIVDKVVGLIGVDKEQAGPLETGSKVNQVVVAYGVVLVRGVDLVGDDEEQGKLPETGNEVVQVVVAYGVVLVHGVDLVGVDDEQARLPEKARTLCLEDITNSLLAKHELSGLVLKEKD